MRQKEEVRSSSSKGSGKKLEEITLEDSRIDEKLDNLDHKLDSKLKAGTDTMYIEAIKEADHHYQAKLENLMNEMEDIKHKHLLLDQPKEHKIREQPYLAKDDDTTNIVIDHNTAAELFRKDELAEDKRPPKR